MFLSKVTSFTKIWYFYLCSLILLISHYLCTWNINQTTWWCMTNLNDWQIEINVTSLIFSLNLKYLIVGRYIFDLFTHVERPPVDYVFSPVQFEINHVQVYLINFQIRLCRKLSREWKNVVLYFALFLHKELHARFYTLFGRILYIFWLILSTQTALISQVGSIMFIAKANSTIPFSYVTITIDSPVVVSRNV